LGTFAILRTFLAYRSNKLQKLTLDESRRYWGSWSERSKDVATKVLSEISTRDLEIELDKRKIKRKKKCPTQE
jgi:hypothetical protein